MYTVRIYTTNLEIIEYAIDSASSSFSAMKIALRKFANAYSCYTDNAIDAIRKVVVEQGVCI